MPATPLDPSNLSLGAGWLWIAPVGSTAPTNLTTAWTTADTDWLQMGYTEDGHTFSVDVTTEGVYVAEVLAAVRAERTEVKIMVEFNAAEVTARNLKYALNGGTLVTTATETTMTPPTFTDAPTEWALGWEARDASERLIWPRVVNTKATQLKRAKPTAYTTIPFGFIVLADDTGSPYTHLLSLART